MKLDLQDEEDHKYPIRDNKVTYSRVSKKIDVRRLKKNVWKSINNLIQVQDTKKGEEENSNDSKIHKENEPNKELKFSDIIHGISTMYSNDTLKDISTSFCFICLLHLANEHGLQITNTENYEDLVVNYEGLATAQTTT